LRGPLNTFKLLSYEKSNEKKFNIKTLSIVNLKDLTLAGIDSVENHHYQGASYYILFKVFNLLPQELKNKTLIDYGCGKGRALFVAEDCGFKKLIGVDIAKELIDDAKNNEVLYKKKNLDSQFRFEFEDATKYKIPNDADVFYFFNPFGKQILQEVINNIKNSLLNHPRTIYCIYLNPLYDSIFEENGFNVYKTIKSWRYLEGIIYTIN
jgi:SAM-dependent methyltransferase